MKRLQLAVLCTLFSQVLTAQDYKYVEQMHQIVGIVHQFTLTDQVKQITIKKDYGNGDKNSQIVKYKASGQKESVSYFDKKGELGTVETWSYNPKGWITEVKHIGKGINVWQDNYEYTEKGMLTLLQRTNKRGKLWQKDTWSYDDLHRMTEHVQYRRENPKYLWKYEYDSEGKKAKSYYYKKNKLLKESTYECDAEGKVLKKRERQVCQYQETDDNHLLKIYESVDAKGKIRKTIYKYTLPDTLIVEYAYKYNDSVYSYKHTFDGSFEKPLTREAYHKGALRSMSIWEYEGDLITKQIEKRVKRSKLITTYRSELSYNNKLLEKLVEHRKGKLYSTTTLTYEL